MMRRWNNRGTAAFSPIQVNFIQLASGRIGVAPQCVWSWLTSPFTDVTESRTTSLSPPLFVLSTVVIMLLSFIVAENKPAFWLYYY